MTGIEDFLGSDHDRLDDILSAAREEAARGDLAGAAARLAELRLGLERHMTWEEETLFPAALQAVPGSNRHIESLRIDHERIRRMLDLAQASGDAAAARNALDDLRLFLEGHNRDEEHGVYPDVDRALPEEARRQLLAAFAAPPLTPEHRQKHLEPPGRPDGVGDVRRQVDLLAGAHPGCLRADPHLRLPLDDMQEGFEGGRVLAELLASVEGEQGNGSRRRLFQDPADNTTRLIVDEACHGLRHQGPSYPIKAS